ncbi:4415_t:CDS:10 [Ambispora leptoticha]|uniref:Alpha-1,3/1,6-mannosyltransferase ALG2 n=1 Tax=Ambispora leptoticha TaxID=144679 RepID=A0A9N9CSA2_9GLOM|nr:4415_t:CDS:10 [Ambispora leptoticha]
MSTSRALNIVFVHPDLGIGGAERLVVDAAVGLQERGHKISIYTSYHDPTHCFEETRNGKYYRFLLLCFPGSNYLSSHACKLLGLLNVNVRGNWLIPRTFFGSFYIICAMLRQFHLALTLLLWDRPKIDVIFIDQLSANIPLLKFTGAKILFYCHFPDKLLTGRGSILKKLYRMPVDKFEEMTTGMADAIVVNSKFTANVFRDSFPSIKQRPEVLYPGIHFTSYDKAVDLNDESVKILERFERKKNIALAINAFAALRDNHLVPSTEFQNLRLIIAGGYDYRVKENVEHHLELEKLASRLGLSNFTISPGGREKDVPPSEAQIIFLCSFSEAQRTFLLSRAICLLYTPSNEHFGIVPVESMYASLPVIAVNSGGPTESILDKVTGFLCDPTPEAFSQSIAKLLSGNEFDCKVMGEQGRKRVQSLFSLTVFIDTLEDILRLMLQIKVRHINDLFGVTELTEQSTFEELKRAIQERTGIPPEKQEIRIGYPPSVASISGTTTISAAGIKNGDVVILNEISAKNEAAKMTIEREKNKSRKEVISVASDHGIIALRQMEDDNSCLFRAIGNYVLERSPQMAQSLRQIIIDHVQTEPETYPDVFLERPREEYCKWIAQPNSWGGAIELAIFSAHYKVEIRSVDVKTGRIDRYDYDALALTPSLEASEEYDQTIFKASEDYVIGSAIAVARKMKELHMYTYTADFTLLCGECNKGIVGEKEATQHAQETGHTKFTEYA